MSATRITGLTCIPLNLPLTEPFSIATGTQHEAQNVLVQITLQDGTTGLGEAAPFPAVSSETQQSTLQALQQIESTIMGADAREWRTLANTVKQLIPTAPATRCAIEMAVLDALCRHYHLPLYVFFGGCGTTLTTDMTIPAGDVAHARDSAMAIAARGIHTIKVKTTGTNVALDVARLVAIHEAAPTAPLIVDGNCGYNTDRALDFTTQLKKAAVGICLFEQPVPCTDWQGMADITRLCGVPVVADESARSAADVLKLVQLKAANVINIKLMKCGIAEALDMIAIARAAGLQLMIGGMVESLLAMSFSAHLAAGMGCFDFADLDTPMFIKDHPFTGGFAQTADVLTLDRSAPGHGVQLKKPAL